MIELDEFIELINSSYNPLNQEQEVAVRHPADSVLQIVAGPGSGKTSVLLIRALRLVFVDDILPDNILITTFTKKAANDIRSRWIQVGERLHKIVSEHHDTNMIDLNRCQIGTLDSITEQVLSEYRPPGTTSPAVMSNVTADLVLRRRAFASNYRQNQSLLNEFLARYTFDGKEPFNQRQALETTRSLLHRLTQDLVDQDEYSQEGEAQALIVDILEEYKARSVETNAFDFTLMEELLLNRLIDGTIGEWTDSIRAMFIDEYQDTNPLQEAIYFSIIRSANPSTTIVGDDDQSLYRFRGGSVELFTQFGSRCHQATGHQPNRVDIVRNYRSTPEIIDFYNNHISGDPGFAGARIRPPKPNVFANRPSNGVTVLGMFRHDEETLAHNLAEFLDSLVRQKQYSIPGTNLSIQMTDEGNLGDITFLGHTIRETRYNNFPNSETPTTDLFPLKLRGALEGRGLQVFNPRGQALRDIPNMQILLGLTLLVADPDGDITEDIRPTGQARFFLSEWRDRAEKFVNSDPKPRDGRGIRGFIDEWQSAAGGNRMGRDWTAEWPVLEVIYKLITWMPAFQDDPEHQVWLQALMETIDGASIESPYRMMLQNDVKGDPENVHIMRSRASFINDALIPIAENDEDIDEDILPSVPRDRLQFMTIHQAKGLEFPLAIVDVGSRFRRAHPSQAFRRFPSHPSNVVKQEDDVEPFLGSPLRGARTPLDRSFDDLARLYYVAYSRAQSVLLLIGQENCLKYERGAIPNVALGWNRDRKWPWRQPYKGRKKPISVNPPLTMI